MAAASAAHPPSAKDKRARVKYCAKLLLVGDATFNCLMKNFENFLSLEIFIFENYNFSNFENLLIF